MPKKKPKLTKQILERIPTDNKEPWRVQYGQLKRGKGNPGSEHLFRVLGEKIPYAELKKVSAHARNHARERGYKLEGVYVAHDSMGCPRYIGRGKVFGRLEACRKSHQPELSYFSFYLVSDKKHEREIETLLIRAASFLLEFNEKKKRIGISHGNIHDYEAGTYFYERQRKKGRK